MARKKAPEPEPEEEEVPVEAEADDEAQLAADDEDAVVADDDTDSPEDDEPADDDAGDADDHPDISQFFGGGGGGGDDDDDAAEVGVTDDDYEDEDEGTPIYKRPILLASIGLLLLVGVAVGWTWVSFDHEAYDAANAPPTLVATLVAPPARPAPAEAAAPEGEAHAPEAAVAPAGAATPGPAAAPAATAAATPPAAAARPTTPATPAAPTPEAAPAAPAATVALVPAPDPALVAPGENGPLPIIGEDGRQPWRVYARPFALPPETPKIGIVIGGMGLSRAATLAAIQQLPPDVTLAFAPYAPNLEAQIAEARAAGHEVILQLPMEPMGYPANDPGPHTLLANAAAEDNLARLHWLLSRFTGYIGVTNYMGAKLSTSEEALKPILADLNARGLMFLDARETTSSIAANVAAELNMPRAINNRFLDAEASRTSVDARLLELERIALQQGGAIGIGYAYPVTIERVAAWIRTLRDKNVALAPLSALARTSSTN